MGVAEDSHSKLKVLQALTRKFKLQGDVDLSIVAEKCPPTFTGADMYALSSDAWMTALKRTVAQVSLAWLASFCQGRQHALALYLTKLVDVAMGIVMMHVQQRV